MSMGSSAWKGWVLDEDDSIPILRHALDLGINFFDMADWYSTGGNEEVVGKNLLRMSARERLVLATKVYYPMSDDPNDLGLSRKHIASSIDRSLARMGTDYVDLYVIHAFDTAWDVEHRRPIASHASLHINAVAACPGDLAVTEDPLLISPWVARLDAKRRAGNGIAVPFHVAPTNRVRRPIVCASSQTCAGNDRVPGHFSNGSMKSHVANPRKKAYVSLRFEITGLR
jgi:hypothetical protein